MKKKDLKQQIAEDICELNCWRTPRRFKNKNFKEEEIDLVIAVLESYVPYSEWIKVWIEQDLGKQGEKT